MKLRLDWLAGWFVSAASLLVGRFVRVNVVDRQYWTHRQNGHVHVELFPNCRLSDAALESLCSDIYFYGYTPANGDVCIDVGASVGMETAAMSRLVGGGKVFAIEASPRVFGALQVCIGANGLQNVVADNCAIANENGTIGITDHADHHVENHLAAGSGPGTRQVPCWTMDDYVANHGITRIDFLKVNIEGAERLLIDAFSSIRIVRHAAISCHDFLGVRTGDRSLFTRDAVTKFLRENGFEVHSRSTGVDYQDDWLYATNSAALSTRT